MTQGDMGMYVPTVLSGDEMRDKQITREPMPYGSVLVVDDVESNIFVAKGLLAPYGLKIDTAESGLEAIDKIKNGNIYDIVLMDHLMPKMDGIEATTIIRDMGYQSAIVALTANTVSGQADFFIRNGFDDFISKPIDIRKLNTVLNRLIRDKQSTEVLETAAQQLEKKNVQSSENTRQSSFDSGFVEIFVRDVNKVLVSLESLNEKNDYIDEKNMRTYIVNMSVIKSSLSGVGNMELVAVAMKLESAGREKRLEIIASETKGFIDSLKVFMENLKRS